MMKNLVAAIATVQRRHSSVKFIAGRLGARQATTWMNAD
jgi:hypothetical protein